MLMCVGVGKGVCSLEVDWLGMASAPQWLATHLTSLLSQRIYDILKPGGVLLNFGPLLYHFEDDVAAPSLELSYTELRDVLCSRGFVIEVGARAGCQGSSAWCHALVCFCFSAGRAVSVPSVVYWRPGQHDADGVQLRALCGAQAGGSGGECWRQ